MVSFCELLGILGPHGSEISANASRNVKYHTIGRIFKTMVV